MEQLVEVDRSAWLAHISDMKGDAAVRDIKNLPDDGHLYAAHVINDIWRITNGNAIVVTDVGQHQMWEAQYYHHESPRSLITSGGLGTMGFALPAAIGAKVGKPDAEVWVVVGDGGFQMTLCELATMMQEDLDVKNLHHQQRISRHGAPVAGVLLPAAIRGDADHRARVPEAGRGVRCVGRDRHVASGRGTDGGDRAPAEERGAHRLPRRAGRLGVPDGAGR
ncbi:MAG: thiamine pyrophosphate-dependent enzyme [Vicinamibacterales bacterium]